MTEKRKNKHLGASFDAFLVEEGLYEEATSVAWKRVLSWEVSEAMKKEGISKSEMAKRMSTSRSQLERLLDPDNPNVLLETVQKAASAGDSRQRNEHDSGSRARCSVLRLRWLREIGRFGKAGDQRLDASNTARRRGRIRSVRRL